MLSVPESLGVVARVISLEEGAVTREYSLMLPNVSDATALRISLRYYLFSLRRASFASSL